MRSLRPYPQRYSTATVRPSIQPSSLSLWRKASTHRSQPGAANYHSPSTLGHDRVMGFNRPKMEADRKAKADAEAAAHRATDAQVLEDAERLITAWNESQARQMPMLFSPTIGAAIAAGYWFLWVRCPACRTINAIDLRTLDRHHDAGVTSLIPALSCRSCRPNAPFAELIQLSRKSIADEMREEHRRRAITAARKGRICRQCRLPKATGGHN
jgi:hypothetical protein